MKQISVALGVGVGLLAAVGLSAGTHTSAAGLLDPVAVRTVTLGRTTEVLALQVDKLVPGSGTSARFLLQRGGSSGGSFGVRVEDVEDFERGCGAPERGSGDVTCGDAEGELSQQLLVALGWSTPTDCARAAVPDAGLPMASLTGRALLAPMGAERSDAVCLVLSVHLPIAADNLVQSDAVTFSLRLGEQGGTPRLQDPLDASRSDYSAPPGPTPHSGGSWGSAVLPGDLTTRTPGAGGTTVMRPSTLPFTGGRPGGLLVDAALCCAGGVGLAVAGRRRDQTSVR